MVINYRFSLLLADRVNSLQTPVIIDRSVEENSQFMESTSTISLLSITNTEEQIFNNETPMQKREINTYYLLAGAGAVIFMLLFIIVIQTCRKSKSAKRKSSLQYKCNENQTGDETFKQPPHGSSENYLNITSSKQSNHVYQHMDHLYQEIDESMELIQMQPSTDTATEFGDHNLPYCINNPINVTKYHINAQPSESYVIPSTCLDIENTDYLQPVIVHANKEIKSKQETLS